MEAELRFILPVKKPYELTKHFGPNHDGIDIAGEGYDSPIFASESGKVYKAFYDNMGGNQIILSHEDNMFTVYSHLNRINVFAGEDIRKDQKIGTMGNTGMSTMVHLHFSIWNGEPFGEGRPVDPLEYLKIKED